MILTTEGADRKFSLMIRERDKVCARCKLRKATQCSHYYERHHSATRYHPDNGDGVCEYCHPLWEGRKNGYREYKIKQIGKKRFAELERLYRGVMKRDDAIIQFMELLKTHEQDRKKVLSEV